MLEKKISLFANNKGNEFLTQLEATLELSDKLDSVVEAINNIPETVIPETVIPEPLEEVRITNLPEVQKVEITNLPTEKDDKEQLALLKEISSELKKKEEYAYDIEIDPVLKEQLRGEKGESGKDGKNGTEITANEVALKLESLEGEDRLDISAIKGAEEMVDDIATSIVKAEIKKIPKPSVYMGARGSTSSGVQSVVAGTNITVDNTDPANPIVSATGGSGDMTKAVYDVDNDGRVDVAEKLNIEVLNKTGATLTKLTPIYLKSTSSSANYPEALLADATTEATSSKTLGLVISDIANNATGFVVTKGELHNVDTSAYSVGDKLWLGTTAGTITTTKPTQPNHAVFIGTVIRSQLVNGRIDVQIQNGYELDELHDVLISGVANDDFLQRKSGLWSNRTVAQVKTDLGLTGTNSGDQTITLTGEATGSGTGSFAVTLTNSAVIGKVLTGLSLVSTTVISATDTILVALGSLQAQITALTTTVGTKVSSVSATGPVTSSGGTTPTISTSMSTGKLIGRGTAGTGVFEEITLGTNLSLSGTTLNATGGGGGSFTVTSAEIDFGSIPVKSKRITVTDAAITTSSKIMVTPNGATATGRVGNDWEWDTINFSVVPGTGNFVLTGTASGRIVGKRKIFYTYS